MAKKQSYKKNVWKTIIFTSIGTLIILLLLQIAASLSVTGKLPGTERSDIISMLITTLPAIIIFIPLFSIILFKAEGKQQGKMDVLRAQISSSKKIIDEGIYISWKENRNYYVFLTEKDIILFPLTKLNIAAKQNDFAAYLTTIRFSDITEAYVADSKMILKTQEKQYSVQCNNDANLWMEHLAPFLDQ